jgi:hypothetical protein
MKDLRTCRMDRSGPPTPRSKAKRFSLLEEAMPIERWSGVPLRWLECGQRASSGAGTSSHRQRSDVEQLLWGYAPGIGAGLVCPSGGWNAGKGHRRALGRVATGSAVTLSSCREDTRQASAVVWCAPAVVRARAMSTGTSGHRVRTGSGPPWQYCLGCLGECTARAKKAEEAGNAVAGMVLALAWAQAIAHTTYLYVVPFTTVLRVQPERL